MSQIENENSQSLDKLTKILNKLSINSKNKNAPFNKE